MTRREVEKLKTSSKSITMLRHKMYCIRKLRDNKSRTQESEKWIRNGETEERPYVGKLTWIIPAFCNRTEGFGNNFYYSDWKTFKITVKITTRIEKFTYYTLWCLFVFFVVIFTILLKLLQFSTWKHNKNYYSIFSASNYEYIRGSMDLV